MRRNAIKKLTDGIVKADTSNDEGRAIKSICCFIMEFHARKQHQLSDHFLQRCSEMSIITKYFHTCLHLSLDRIEKCSSNGVIPVPCIALKPSFRFALIYYVLYSIQKRVISKPQQQKLQARIEGHLPSCTIVIFFNQDQTFKMQDRIKDAFIDGKLLKYLRHMFKLG